jgi:murein DD-endopeptidase MepM/ murein hydrolase activator NlpD
MKRVIVLIISFSLFPILLFSQELPPPVPSRYITDDYGPRNLEGDYNWHGGIDYRADTGTTITAVEGGNVVYIRPYSQPGGGWRIRIHGDQAYWTQYRGVTYEKITSFN